MADPYIGEIRIFGFNFAPRGWATCNGQILAIAQNTALFSILGTTYGGNGQTTFALPNLQTRLPIGFGDGPGLSPRSLGEEGGTPNVTITTTTMPAHSHAANCSTTGAPSTNPTNRFWGQVPTLNLYRSAHDTTMNPNVLDPTGGSQPHNNMQPYLVLLFCICTSGNFPPRN